MKRIFVSSVFILLTLVLLCTNALAEETVHLEELGLNVTVPDEYWTITKDTPEDAEVFEYVGTTKADILEHFQSSNIYFNAVSKQGNEEIVGTMVENDITDFNLFSDTMLTTIADNLVKEYVNYGINTEKFEIYQHSQAKFIKVYFTDAAETVHGLQYYTIYANKAINFTMRSYVGYLSETQEATIKTLVDSVSFTAAPAVSEEGEDTDPIYYTDPETEASFTVPANWKEEDFYKEREFLDVKFGSTKDDGCLIQYGSTDIWELMPDDEKSGYVRSDICNHMFTTYEIAEMCGIDSDEIHFSTYNDIEYFSITTKSDNNSYGMTVTATQMIYIENGWMYFFYFSGDSDHKLYSEFESLLESVEYPEVTEETSVAVALPEETIPVHTHDHASTENNADKTENSDTNTIIIVAVAAVVAVIAIILVIVILNKRKKKAPANTPFVNTPPAFDPNQYAQPQAQLHCSNCGHLLKENSKFCPVCGTPVNRNIQ